MIDDHQGPSARRANLLFRAVDGILGTHNVFDFLRAETDPWWGRQSETGFLGQLYDLDALPSTDPRHATAGEDIARHRVANFDWDDDWVFDDPRFQLADGPDQVLLDFLAHMATPWSSPTPTRPHGW
jgi:hypothetical protein